ncbi:hypothetical protein [Agrobacterium pusense]|uniref:hypothetical protein n=1 Tax=Agrobacterium pusense TaxID=648995 RepID=UPI0010ADA5FB|nr:hypothetical protein [Agrobacterium pusense]WCK26616.1 hypothetical protein CFBP5496_0020665 [Agrobacterium pusense]
MHRGTEIDGDIEADANQSDVSPSIELDGFVPFEIPLAAVIAKLRGRTLVRVLAAHRERDESDQR